LQHGQHASSKKLEHHGDKIGGVELIEEANQFLIQPTAPCKQNSDATNCRSGGTTGSTQQLNCTELH
jgi:hypothetical protein